MLQDTKPALEDLHPSIWRASQLARSATRVVSSGHQTLDCQLPGGGWPTGAVTELHISAAGTGEMRMLAPVFSAIGKRSVVLIQPPHVPNALALASMGLSPSQIIWVQPDRSADALWAAEQALRLGNQAIVMLWQAHTRNDSIRRLNLVAAESECLCFLARPLAAAQDSSPAPLRLALRPAVGGLELSIIKRRGAQLDSTIFLPLSPSFVHRHAVMDRRPVTPAVAGGIQRELVD